jgi:hypothetical protein
MGRAGKAVARMCILSTLFMGCYGSVATVEPTDEGKLPRGKIFAVVTKDSVTYQFDSPATVVGDSIVGKVEISMEGVVMRQRVSIPVANAAYVSLKNYKPVSTIILVAAIASGVLVAGFSASLSGWHIAGK